MRQIIEKLKPELKKAIEIIAQNFNPFFRVKVCNTRKEFDAIQAGSMSSCRIGQMQGKSFKVGAAYTAQVVQMAMTKEKFPKNVKYKNGVLYIEEEFPGDLNVIYIEEEFPGGLNMRELIGTVFPGDLNTPEQIAVEATNTESDPNIYQIEDSIEE